jgi:hypothetical protein
MRTVFETPMFEASMEKLVSGTAEITIHLPPGAKIIDVITRLSQNQIVVPGDAPDPLLSVSVLIDGDPDKETLPVSLAVVGPGSVLKESSIYICSIQFPLGYRLLYQVT